MSKHPTLLQQFRSFCYQNNAADIEKAIEYFAVFGGMGWNVDMNKPLEELIEEKILANYRYLHGDLTKITQSNKTHHALLTALAVGDRREHSAFRRANLQRREGEASAEFLIKNGLLIRETSQEEPADENEEVSDRLLFSAPFMRFWFSSVSPYYKGIKEGDYTEVKERWENTKQAFYEPVYEGLVIALVKQSFKEDWITKIGSYWDKNGEIEILGQTKSGKIIAGSCKYSKAKANKAEVTKLQEKCARAKLNPDIFVIFSKSGFSSEFKKEKGEGLKLFALKNLRTLMEGLSEKDLLLNTNKKY
ncbi:MAG: ATPase [Campylobacterales bacterium]|nr:ATPase [Campylobacterales bacterium]